MTQVSKFIPGLLLKKMPMGPMTAMACCVVVFTACQSNQQKGASDTETQRDHSDSDSDDDSHSVATDDVADTETETDTWAAKIGALAFRDDQILNYHITMDEELLDEMMEHGNDEAYRPAEVHITGHIAGDDVDEFFPKVGIRYKGEYSLHHCWNNSGQRSYAGDCARLSMKIKFSEYFDDARFDGLKRLNLHGMGGDDTKMRERLGYQLYNEFDVTTSRTAYARFQVNEEPPFLVLAVEQIDGRFTAHHYYPNGDGNLYKEIWPGDMLSESAARAALKTNDNPEDNANVSQLLSFGTAVSEATSDDFVNTVGSHTDLTHLLRYMAVDRAIKNWDGITAFYWHYRPHNFYWYHDTGGTEQHWLVPWDLDNTFWEYDPYMDPAGLEAEKPMPDWNVKPASCAPIRVWNEFDMPPCGCDPFINLLAESGWHEFAQLGAELLDGPFQYALMDEKITGWQNQIRSIVEEDTYIDASRWDNSIANLRTILQRYITDFEAHLDEGYIVE